MRAKQGGAIGVFGGQLVVTPAKKALLNPNLVIDPANGTRVEFLRDLPHEYGPIRINAFVQSDPPRVCTG